MSRFQHLKSLSIGNFSKRRMFLAVSLGLTSCVLFYFWQQYLFVLFRTINTNFKYNVDYFLSENSIHKLSLYFAGNAVILGNSIFISFLCNAWDKNRTIKRRIMQIRNNQSFLIGSYFFWSFKIVFLIFSVNVFGFTDYGLVEALFYIIPFLFVSLFLESVKGLRRFWKFYNLKIILIHSLFLGTLLFGLSFVNRSVYNEVAVIQEKENPFVSLPHLNHNQDSIYDDGYYSYRKKDYIKVIDKPIGVAYRIFRQEYSLKELITRIVESSDHSNYWQTVSLYVSSDTPYHKLEDLEWSLSYHGLQRIYYMTFDNHTGSVIPFKKSLYLTKEMFENREDGFPAPPYFYLDMFDSAEKTTVSISDFLFSNSIDKQKLEAYFYNHLSKETFFEFKIGNDITLRQYIDFISSYRSAVRVLRNEYEYVNPDSNSSIEYPHKYMESFTN